MCIHFDLPHSQLQTDWRTTRICQPSSTFKAEMLQMLPCLILCLIIQVKSTCHAAVCALPHCLSDRPGCPDPAGLKLTQPTVLEQYVLAIRRMKEQGGYKRWRFSKNTPEFDNPHALRSAVTTESSFLHNPATAIIITIMKIYGCYHHEDLWLLPS